MKHDRKLTVARSKKLFTRDRISSRKRKSPGTGAAIERRAPPFDQRLQQKQDGRTPSVSRSPSVSSSGEATSSSSEAYNGTLELDDDGFVFCQPVSVFRYVDHWRLTFPGVRTRCCFCLHYRLSYLGNEAVYIRVGSTNCCNSDTCEIRTEAEESSRSSD
jgi:hypothetical protein